MLGLSIWFIMKWMDQSMEECQLVILQKEMWDRHEGTTKVKEARIWALVNEYEILKINDDEGLESMFSWFSKILQWTQVTGNDLLK